MLIGSTQKLARCDHPSIDVYVDDHPLEQITTYKYLGVYIDCNLKWTDHTEHVASSVTEGIRVLNRLKNVLFSLILM